MSELLPDDSQLPSGEIESLWEAESTRTDATPEKGTVRQAVNESLNFSTRHKASKPKEHAFWVPLIIGLVAGFCLALLILD